MSEEMEVLSLITKTAEPCPKSSNYSCIRLAELTELFMKELALAEKRGHENALATIKNGYNDFSCPKSKLETKLCPENYSCWDCYFKGIGLKD